MALYWLFTIIIIIIVIIIISVMIVFRFNNGIANQRQAIVNRESYRIVSNQPEVVSYLYMA